MHDEISPETQHADLRHEPDPARKAERARLGLLGRITAVPCLLEVYGHAPSAEEFRACLAKHIAFWQKRTREARARKKKRRQRQRPEVRVAPSLWIITAGAPRAILRKLKLEPARGWPAGVYFFGDDILRVRIVVASRLPRKRKTLLVRLMAAGPLLTPAIEDLSLLPRKARERAVAEHILLDLQHALKLQPRRNPDEEEFIVTMRRSWEDARIEGRTEGRAEGHIEGRIEGRAEGRIEARAKDVLTVLRVRGIAVPAAVRKRILAEKDLQRLERWHEKAILAASVEEVLEDRAASRAAKTVRAAARKERTGRRPLRAAAQR
ncbi:MAG TPA: hypothetical protein VNO30_13820 [Kofleriaceae bacterium]|nr:hypothetical protein [Kofleriaceae bacterium]